MRVYYEVERMNFNILCWRLYLEFGVTKQPSDQEFWVTNDGFAINDGFYQLEAMRNYFDFRVGERVVALVLPRQGGTLSLSLELKTVQS